MKPDTELRAVSAPLMRNGETWVCWVDEFGSEHWSRLSPGQLVSLPARDVERADRFVNRVIAIFLWLATAYVFAHLLVAAGVGR